MSENTFEESIGKITEIEPLILATATEKKATAANTSAIKELQDSIANKGKRKERASGGRRDDSTSKDKSNGLTKKVIICAVPVTRDTMVRADFFQVTAILELLQRRVG